MTQNVLHLVRKLLPFTASFIRNQIVNHIEYTPTVFYTEKVKTPFFNEITKNYTTNCLINEANNSFIYKKFRKLKSNEKRNLINLINLQKPRIIHIHYGVDAIVFSEALKSIKIPVIVSFYGYDCTSFPKLFWGLGKRILVKKVFKNPSIKKVIAMSEDMKNDLLKLGCPEEKILVHYYGTDTKAFNMTRKYNNTGTVNYLIISGLAEKKGHKYLIESFLLAQKNCKEKTHLHIVGDGKLKYDIIQKIESSGSSNITYHGPIEYGSNEHYKFLNESDVFIHPSITAANGDKEGIPGAIIEAMSSGLPVISTLHAGIPNVIKNQVTGLLVSEFDTEALAKSIALLANNSSLRIKLGKNAKAYANKNLDIKNKEKELENIYNQVISEC